jgi:hypothetical protein
VNGSRCPACAAAVRPDAQWCGLCYLDLRPARAAPSHTAVTAAPSAIPAQRASASAPLAPSSSIVTSTDTSDTATWPCTQCSARVPLELSACPDCGAAFLARLAGDGGRHRSSTENGGLTRVSRPARLVAGLVFGVLVAVLVPLLLALFG